MDETYFQHLRPEVWLQTAELLAATLRCHQRCLQDHMREGFPCHSNGTIQMNLAASCHDRDRTHPYTPYPDLSMPIPSHLNHSRAPNTKPEPSDPLASQQRTPEHSNSLASRQPHSFPTRCLSTFSLLASVPFPTFHRSRDCGRAKPDRVPPSLDAS